MEKKLREWIEKEKHELRDRKEKANYKPKQFYIMGRLDALDLLEKEVLD